MVGVQQRSRPEPTVGIIVNIALASCSTLPDWEVDDRPLWEALRRRGIEFEQPDWRDPSVSWDAFDAVLIRTTWDYTDYPDQFLKWAEQVSTQTLLLNSLEIVRWNFNKLYLKDLQNKGASIAPTVWLLENHTYDIRAIMNKHGWKRGFIKPVVGACAIGTLRFSIEESDLAAAHLLKLETGCMLQPYIETVEQMGEFSLIYFDGRLSHAVQKIPVSGDYRVQDDYGASDKAIVPPVDLLSVGERTLSILDEQPLYARIDALLYRGKWVLNELELIEPSLFFRHSSTAADMLCSALIKKASNRDPVRSF